jgi:hypothetical protein
LLRVLWLGAAAVTCGGLATGCGSQEPSVAVPPPTSGVEPAEPALSFDVASCPHYPQSPEMDRVCIVDSQGKTYQVGTTPLWVLPAAPPYTVYFQFNPDYTPAVQDLDTTGDRPAIGAYAGPYNIYDTQNQRCCAEGSPANRISSQVALTANRGLLVTVTDAQPSGDQLVVMLSYASLFKSRTNPCTFPGDFCRYVDSSTFGARFYVDSGPTGPTPPPTTGQP